MGRPGQLVHATCVAVEGRAALLLGASGAGKSDLALRLITGTFRVGERTLAPALVADDQVLLEARDGRLQARAPDSLAGKVEVRGLGILDVSHTPTAEVRLAVNLVAPSDVERYPEPGPGYEVLGLRVPQIYLAPFEASAVNKVLLALLRSPG